MRRAALVLAITLAGCQSAQAPILPTSVAPGSTETTAQARAIPMATHDPCPAAATRLTAFSERVSGALAALRPLIVARFFDAPESLSVVRQVSALITFDSGLVAVLEGCAVTNAMASEVGGLLDHLATGSRDGIEASFSDPWGLRDAAVALWKQLPVAVSLNAEAVDIGRSLGLAVAVIPIPNDADAPLGKLSPIVVATAQETTPPSGGSGTASGGTSGSSSYPSWPAWLRRAYKADARATYDQAVREANYEIAIAGFQAPGDTAEERAARMAAAIAQAAYNLLLALRDHFDFLKTYPPARCVTDAYSADTKLGDALWRAAQALVENPYGDPTTIAALTPRREAFLSKLDSYLSDC